jgi:hypothetical protein
MRQQHRWHGRPSLVVVALAAAGCGIFAEPDAGLPIEDVRTTGRPLPGALADRPTGPHVELLTGTVAGEEIEVAMQRDGEGVCFAVRMPPESGEACAERIGDQPLVEAFGPVMPIGFSDPDSDPSGHPQLVAGLVAPDVEAVVAELESGAVARATLFPLAPAQVDGSGFVVALPIGAGHHAILAFDADGTEIGRLEVVAPGP